MKWSFLPPNITGPIYMCINGDESEPGTFNNRILIEEDPHQVLEGIVIGCYATRATTAYFYLRYEYGRCYRTLQKAVDEMYAAGLLGKDILEAGIRWISIFIAVRVRTFVVKKRDLLKAWKVKELGLESSHPSPQWKARSVGQRL